MLTKSLFLLKLFLFITLVSIHISIYAQTDIVQQGWTLEWNGDFKEAYDKFQSAIQQYPDSSRAWKGKADMEMELFNDSTDAMDDYNTAIGLNPKAVHAYFA
jgi:tetratricopeptide (TPR) repeat protein